MEQVTLSWCPADVSPLRFHSQMLIEWNEAGFKFHGLESGLLLGEKSGEGAPLPPGIVSVFHPHVFLVCVFIIIDSKPW